MGAKVRVLCTRRYCSTCSDETTVTALFSDTIWFQQTFQHLQGILVNADPPPLYADPLGPLPLTPKTHYLILSQHLKCLSLMLLSSILLARRDRQTSFWRGFRYSRERPRNTRSYWKCTHRHPGCPTHP